MNPRNDPPELRTYDQWLQIGYVVKKGQKTRSYRTLKNGSKVALFDQNQVKINNYFYDDDRDVPRGNLEELYNYGGYFDDIGDR